LTKYATVETPYSENKRAFGALTEIIIEEDFSAIKKPGKEFGKKFALRQGVG
jgi:hypothetical protein